MTRDPPERPTFIGALKDSALSSVTTVSVLTFVLVAVKVFRASGMEASTTAAVVIGADLVALLEGVILTLLPSFIGLVIAGAIGWWAWWVPRNGVEAACRKEFLNLDHVTAWTLVAIGFLTVPSPLLVPAIPMFFCGWALFRHVWDDTWIKNARRTTYALVCLLGIGWILAAISAIEIPWGFVLGLSIAIALIALDTRRRPHATRDPKWIRRTRVLTLLACFVSAILNIYYLALSPTVWLPLRQIELTTQTPPRLKDEVLPREFGAYVLSSDDKRVILLVDDPRAVVELRPDDLEPHPPICVPERSGLPRELFLRPVQLFGIEEDPDTPYLPCNDTRDAS